MLIHKVCFAPCVDRAALADALVRHLRPIDCLLLGVLGIWVRQPMAKPNTLPPLHHRAVELYIQWLILAGQSRRDFDELHTNRRCSCANLVRPVCVVVVHDESTGATRQV